MELSTIVDAAKDPGRQRSGAPGTARPGTDRAEHLYSRFQETREESRERTIESILSLARETAAPRQTAVGSDRVRDLTTLPPALAVRLRRWWPMVLPAAAAALLVLTIATSRILQPVEPGADATRWVAMDSSRMLSGIAVPAASHIDIAPVSSFGFSGNLSESTNAFRFGVISVDLLVAASAADRHTMAIVAREARGLAERTGYDRVVETVDGILRRLDQGDSLLKDDARGLVATLGAVHSISMIDPYYRLGQWTETLVLSARVALSGSGARILREALFEVASIRASLGRLEQSPPDTLLRLIDDLEAMQSRGELPLDSVRRIGTIAQQMKLVMG